MEGTRCAFDNNGRILALLSPDGRLKLWDCTVGSLKHEYTPPSHLSSSCTCLRWSRSSRTTVSVSCIPTSTLCVFLKRIEEFAKFTEKQAMKQPPRFGFINIETNGRGSFQKLRLKYVISCGDFEDQSTFDELKWSFEIVYNTCASFQLNESLKNR